MKIVYNKETRRPEDNVFYRKKESWGIEVEDDFSNDNFTEVVPPADSLEKNVPCDWNEATGQWDIDTTTQAHINAVDTLNDSDIPLVRVLEDLINTLVSKGTIALSDLPQVAQDKLNARNDARTNL